MRSSPISVEERFRNQFKQIHSSTYDKRLFDRERMPDQEDEDEDVPIATTSASFEFSADLSGRINNNDEQMLSNFLRASHSNDRTMRPADDEDDGTACTTRDTSLESAEASDAFKCTKRSASVPNSSSDCDGTSEGERSLSLPSKLTGPPFGDSMMSGDSGFVQEHGHKYSRQSTPPNPETAMNPIDLASEMSYQMFLNQLCRQQQEQQEDRSEPAVLPPSNPPQKRSLASASTPERAPTEWKRRRSASPRSCDSPEAGENGTAKINTVPMTSMLSQAFLLPPFAAFGAFQQQMMTGNPESGMPGQNPHVMAAFLSHLQNANFGKSFDDSTRHETATPQIHPNQLMNSLMMATSGGNSSDDDWESMMEVSNTDEAEKIRLMVGDKAAPVTDPNQCLMCRRVLSCKSALQMHYRTHTGERPFKCKICQRAFTTKGNLKTHMSVHKSKHSMHATPSMMSGPGLIHPFLGLPSTPLARPLMDRGEGPPAAFMSPTGSSQCPFCPKRFPAAPLLQQHLIQQHAGLLMPVGPRLFFPRPPLLGTPPTPQQLGAIAAAAGKPPLAALASFLGTPPFDSSAVPPPRDGAMAKHPTGSSTALLSPPPSSQPAAAAVNSPAKRQMSPSSVSSACSQRLSQFSMSALCSEKQKRPAADGVANGDTLGQQLESLKALMGDGQLPENALHQLLLSSLIKNASNMDIKPNDGGGEPPANFFSPAAFFGGAALTGGTTDESTTELEHLDESAEAQPDSDEGAQEPKRPKIELMDEPQSSQTMARISEAITGGATGGTLPSSLEAMEKMCAVAEPTPSPRPMAPLSKHQCGVCRKNFSSSSALQIHMRTHTGERPFKCDTCSHTFTTRGNLKVHMGTHSYQPNPPRRGRRIFDYHMSGGAGSPVDSEMSPSLLGRQSVSGFGQTSATHPTAPLAFPAFLAAAVAASAAAAAAGGGATASLDALLNAGGVLPPALLAAALSAAATAPQPQLPPAEDVTPASPLAACPICRASFATAAEMQSHFETHIAAFAEAAAGKFDETDEAADASADAGRFNGSGDGGADGGAGGQPLIGAKVFV